MLGMRFNLSTPDFWQKKIHPLALALWPVGEVYKAVTQFRIQASQPRHARIPVLCIGNATVGGTGKTPIVQDITARLRTMGQSVHIILRGYGGMTQDTTRVNLTDHDAQDVGDEALLHAAIAPTWIGIDRYASAEAAARSGAQIVVMDDGLQNISIAPSVRWLVVDAAQGVGNGYGLPAGPLREAFTHALRRVDAVILAGQGDFKPCTDKPMLRLTIGPDAESLAVLKDKLVYCFAGIGQPEKLRAGLLVAKLDVVGARAFPDHHVYTAAEIDALHRRAQLLGATLVTTQKDFVRLPENLRADIIPVDVKVVWENETLLNKLLQQVIHAKA